MVTIAGKGLSENVAAEIERALADHELIKVKLSVGDRDAKKAIIEHDMPAVRRPAGAVDWSYNPALSHRQET